MKREIRIIVSVIMLLVGLILAVLLKPSAPSAAETESQAQLAVENGDIPSYNGAAVYTTPVSIESVSAKNMPPLPTLEKFVPVPQESQRPKQAKEPKARTAHREAVPDLPENFPGNALSRSVKLPKRVHTVIDGDTLQNIAFRYLDSEQRWYEIYQANRELLKDPTALPIGAKLTIPPRVSASKHASRSAEHQASRPVLHHVAKPVEQPASASPGVPLVPFER